MLTLISVLTRWLLGHHYISEILLTLVSATSNYVHRYIPILIVPMITGNSCTVPNKGKASVYMVTLTDMLY